MTIISNILRFLGKKFLDRSLIQQRSAQNSQHFVGAPVQFEVVLNDSHHAICGDGRVYLDPDSSLCRTPKGCRLHTIEHKTGNPTIDACFDSDRLDLWRVGIIPDPDRLATEKGMEIARNTDYQALINQ